MNVWGEVPGRCGRCTLTQLLDVAPRNVIEPDLGQQPLNELVHGDGAIAVTVPPEKPERARKQERAGEERFDEWR